VARGIAADTLARSVDQFLALRGFSAATPSSGRPGDGDPTRSPQKPAAALLLQERAADFVCEEDVRQAVRHAKKITIGERTIVTPAARDLGEQHKVFVQAGWKPAAP
jgi:hypothetical protein